MRDIHELAERVYETGGVCAVTAWADNRGHKEWRFCAPCDTEVPAHQGRCLCCGSPVMLPELRVVFYGPDGKVIGEAIDKTARKYKAAPELLAACAQALDHARLDADDGKLALDALNAIRPILAAAVAKARGEKSC